MQALEMRKLGQVNAIRDDSCLQTLF